MGREAVGDLLAFLAVARDRSFTAAAQVSVSQSALSHTIRLGWEEKLGVRLLTRTASHRRQWWLLANVGSVLSDIGFALDALSDLREKPAGTVASRPVRTRRTPSSGRRCGSCLGIGHYRRD
mgnify:CR=1 FL=1